MKNNRIFSICLFVCSLLLLTTQAFAATSTYIVAPFKVNGPSNYQYLEQALPSMLSARLFWSGKYETSAKQDSILKTPAPENRADAEKMLRLAGADYVFYGNVNILGNEVSIDITALDSKGKQWQKASQSSVNNLISGVQGMADVLSHEIFGKTVTSQIRTGGSASGLAPLSGDFIVNEGNTDVYLNPEFRYQGQDSDRLRSQSVNFAAVSMDIADINDDGNLEILFADDVRTIYAYAWNDGALTQLAEYKLPSGQRPLLVRAFREQGKNLIAVSAYDEADQVPNATILEFNGSAFIEKTKRLPYYVNTALLPNGTRPILIGQDGDRERLFRGSVVELLPQGDGKYVKGMALPNLPPKANVFNFVYVPDKEDPSGYKVVLLSDAEKLQVFSSKGSRLHQSDETFSGGSAYIRLGDSGALNDMDEVVTFSYIPMRMVVQDLDSNGLSELLVNRPISTAATIFKNFRNFPQGEVHSLMWDGIGLNLVWKTRRIKGTIADFQVADPNNDGVSDLVTCVVTYPGALGAGDRKTLLTLFPLNTTLTDPTTKPYGEE